MSVPAAVARRIVFRALSAVRGGEVVLRYPDGRGRRFGDGEGPTYVVDLHRPDAVWEKLGWRTRVGFGEAYVDGDWDADDLVGLLMLLGRNLDRTESHPGIRLLNAIQERRPHRPQRQTVDTAADNVQAHYDLGNEFFQRMLDPTMTYSCAYWERDDQTLEEAQLAKFRLICAKLDLGPEDTVLEIGCGWGGFAVHAAREHGCRVTGLTLSPAQAMLARERVSREGLGHLVEIREQDYRRTTGRFSRVVSIEMLEAIGYDEYDTYFAAIDRVLERDGVALVQTIGVPDSRFERYRRTPDWIQRYVFPGSLLPSVEVLARSVAKTRLVVHGIEEIGVAYARTLAAWRDNLDADLDAVRALGYDDRFLRTWDFYLAFCEAGFAIRLLRDMQIVLTRPLNTSLPDLPAVRPTY